MIFKLPQSFLKLYPSAPTNHLLFIEWFSQVGSNSDSNSSFYKVKKSKKIETNELDTDIISLNLVKQSIQLILVFPRNSSDIIWISDIVLDICNTFYINNWTSIRTYQCIY